MNVAFALFLPFRACATGLLAAATISYAPSDTSLSRCLAPVFSKSQANVISTPATSVLLELDSDTNAEIGREHWARYSRHDRTKCYPTGSLMEPFHDSPYEQKTRTVQAGVVGNAFIDLLPSIRATQFARRDPVSPVALPSRTVDPLSAVALPDGSFVVADFGAQEVTKWSRSADGTWQPLLLLPAEFSRRQPYRIGLVEGVGTIVYDLLSRSFLMLSTDGSLVGTFVSDMQFTQVNDVVGSKGMIVVAGVTRDTRGAAFALHVLDSQFKWVRSFGALPGTTDNTRLSDYGVGTLEVLGSGRLLFSPKSAKPIQEIDVYGKVWRRYTRREQRVTPPESVFVIEFLANGTRRTRARMDVWTPARAFKVGPAEVLYGYVAAGELRYTFVSGTGFRDFSLPSGANQPVLLAVDGVHCRALLRTGGTKNRRLWILAVERSLAMPRQHSSRGINRC